MGIKFDLYEESRVKEYRLVKPQNKVVVVYLLKDGKFPGIKLFIESDEISAALFPDLKFNVSDIS